MLPIHNGIVNRNEYNEYDCLNKMKDGSECEIVFEFDDGIIEKYVHFSRVVILMIRVDGLGFKMKLLVCHIWGRDNYNDC